MRTATFPLEGSVLLDPPKGYNPLGLIDNNPDEEFACWPRQMYIHGMELLWDVLESTYEFFRLDATSRWLYEWSYLASLPTMGRYNGFVPVHNCIVYHGHSLFKRDRLIEIILRPSGNAGSIIVNGDLKTLQPCTENPLIIAAYIKAAVLKE